MKERDEGQNEKASGELHGQRVIEKAVKTLEKDVLRYAMKKRSRLTRCVCRGVQR